MPDPYAIISILLGLLGVLAGIAGIFYAVWESKKRKKIEDFIDMTLDTLDESVRRLGDNGRWAKENIDKLLEIIGSIPDETLEKEAIKAAGFGRGDTKSIQDLSAAVQGHLKTLRLRKDKKV
jgi:hypothetical protein